MMNGTITLNRPFDAGAFFRKGAVMAMDAAALAGASRGTLKSGMPETSVTGVSADTRTLKPGDAFFALRGPSFDGHAFAAEALARGASCVVAESSRAADIARAAGGARCVVAVESTLASLGRLANHVRKKSGAPVVAVTGSAGKTTTKEMIAAILGSSRRVLKTEGNRNNLVGMPLTMMGLEWHAGAPPECAVLELGISEPGEMERLAAIAAPDVAVITNVGMSHLERLGSVDGVARAKGVLYSTLKPGGVKTVNLDDPRVVEIASASPGAAVTYSMENAADVRVKSRWLAASGAGIEATYDVRGREVSVLIPSPAECNVMNGAAAIAACLPLGVSTAEIRDGLSSFVPVHGRMEVLRVGGVTVLDDTYNANPESVASALRTLGAFKGRRVAVLGEMLELGAASAEAHRNAGLAASRFGADMVLAIGQRAAETASGAVAGGLGAAAVHVFGDRNEAVGALLTMLHDGDVVLVKGSRAAGLEYVVERLKSRGQWPRA